MGRSPFISKSRLHRPQGGASQRGTRNARPKRAAAGRMPGGLGRPSPGNGLWGRYKPVAGLGGNTTWNSSQTTSMSSVNAAWISANSKRKKCACASLQ